MNPAGRALSLRMRWAAAAYAALGIALIAGIHPALDEVVALERSRGYPNAQDQVTTYLSDRDWMPLAKMLEDRLKKLDPAKDIAFLTRVAAMAPGVYHMSKLLDQMQGRTRVTTILFYPGSIEGTTGLRFMDLKDREALGNYRVKIYG